MANPDSIKELSQEIAQYLKERGWGPGERSLAISVSIEAAELLEHFQWDDYHERTDQEEIADEIGDIAIYLLQLCEKRNILLGEAIQRKLEKVRQKYPPGVSREQYYETKFAHRGKGKKAPRSSE